MLNKTCDAEEEHHTTTRKCQRRAEKPQCSEDKVPSLEHSDHVETCRGAASRDVTTHEKSEDGNAGVSTLQCGSERGEARREVWCNPGQAHQVKQWQEAEDLDTRHVASLTLGKRIVRSNRRIREEDPDSEESDGDGDQFVCNMTGERWEDLPFPIIIDSGACASVMPSEWCPHVELRNTPQSRAKEFFRAANSNKIYNEGEKLVTMTTKEGTKRDMRFTACNVSKALGSVSQMCKTGHKVVFNPPWHEDGLYIEHIDTGERMWMEARNGLYILSTRVAPRHRQTEARQHGSEPWNQDCPWQVNP